MAREQSPDHQTRMAAAAAEVSRLADAEASNLPLGRESQNQPAKAPVNLPEGAEAAIRKSLEALKKSVSENLPLTMVELLDRIKNDLRLTDGQWEEMKPEISRKLDEGARQQTNEGVALTNTVQNTIKKGVPTITPSFIDNLKLKFSKYAEIFPYIGSLFASMADKAKTDKSALGGIYEKLAGMFGYETPEEKFNKFSQELISKMEQEGLTVESEYKDPKSSVLTVKNATDETIATIKYNTETDKKYLTTSAFKNKEVKDATAIVGRMKNLKPMKIPATAVAAAPGTTPPETTPAQATPETPQAKYARLFKDSFKANTGELDTTDLAKDLQTLKDGGIPEDKIEAEITTAALETSNLSKIYKAAKEILADDKVLKPRLSHLLTKNLSDTMIAQVVEAIKGKTAKSPEEIQKFLDAAYAAKDDVAKLKTVVDTYRA